LTGFEWRCSGRARSTTAAYRQTSVKDCFRALREHLSEKDQALLRVDRGLSFRESAMVLSGDVSLDDASLQRESARLRKSFERLKSELRRLAERDGLVAPKA
jgi:RNA polymerase sigma-70 factor (ECF subfamily)